MARGVGGGSSSRVAKMKMGGAAQRRGDTLRMVRTAATEGERHRERAHPRLPSLTLAPPLPRSPRREHRDCTRCTRASRSCPPLSHWGPITIAFFFFFSFSFFHPLLCVPNHNP